MTTMAARIRKEPPAGIGRALPAPGPDGQKGGFMGQIFIDGSWLDKDNAKISVFDHGLLYGDGIFEGIRAYNGRVFRLREHMTRLWSSARAIELALPYSPEEMERIILEALQRAGAPDNYVRVVITRGKGDLGLDRRKCKKPTVIVIAEMIELYSNSVYEEGIRLITSSLRRVPLDSLPPMVKSLNYLNNILARSEAIRISQAMARVKPRPTAGPLTAASTGFPTCRRATAKRSRLSWSMAWTW